MSASQAVLSRMQPPLHATCLVPHGGPRLVQATSTWSVKTRHAPSRRCRDARVYGHTTTVMRVIGNPLPPSPSLHPPSSQSSHPRDIPTLNIRVEDTRKVCVRYTTPRSFRTTHLAISSNSKHDCRIVLCFEMVVGGRRHRRCRSRNHVSDKARA